MNDHERAIFDVRLHVTSHDSGELHRLAETFVEYAREVAPPGVEVLEPMIRGYRGGSFIPTVEPPSWVPPKPSRHGSGKRGRRRG